MDRKIGFPQNSDSLPTVSIIMNCLDCSRYLREAIDSVYSQTYKDWEIIFWDNASTDNSAAIAKGYDDRLRYFRSERTVKLGRARNWAIEKARGKYIAFLDSDDVWFSTKLDKQVKIFNERNKVSLVYSNYYMLYPNKRKRFALRGKQPEGEVFNRFLYYYPVGLSTAVVRKKTLDDFEIFFDEKLNNAEEFDVFMRLLYKTEAAYLDEPLAIYRIHANMASIRMMSGYPDELIYIIDKFKRMDPVFESKYISAINLMKSKIDYSRAKLEMLQGNTRRVREILRHCKWINHEFFILYLLTYLPSNLLRALLNLKAKYSLGSG